ncbi:Putative U3 small nucleolar RNA-associated protein [Septoria linicola]|uniref:U3 small nucleolar RNA-associated protein n=1 Tax=Septoria linicola TaxID=215465 RepID=A0A9Q9EFL0_9PEZI|nr:putative U3 small nucleolar RNA-associated protein [Septoria linicola]USW49876.1 Putative U3 small nucleolar RNA-associated protein [Septoria linicola]
MSGGIEEPYTIASLAKPLDQENGRVQSAIVYSLNGSRKRKRHEIAVGVDGESVNVYNVQTQSTVSSYALPPQSFLAAPPCSIYCKRAKPLQSQRHTYLAVQARAKDSRSKLVGFEEYLGRTQPNDQQPRAPTKRERKLRDGKVVALDVVPVADSKSGLAPVLVSYQNGNVDCISGDLSETRWEHTSHDEPVVEYAAVTDLDTARRGLLKNREDVLALLASNASDSAHGSAPSLLCQVGRSGQQRQLRVYVLRNVGSTSLQGHRSPLELILSYDLPERYGDEGSSYELHAGSGMLYQHHGQRLVIFDLSGTTPRISFDIGKRSGNVQSFARLSAGAVIAISQGRIVVYDTKFGSVLDSLALPQSSSGSKKDQTTLPSPVLLSHFTDLGLVVATNTTSLIAFQLGEALEDVKRSRTQGALLADVFSKGKFTNDAQHVDVHLNREKKRKKWEDWMAKIDTIASQHDSHGLERRVAKDLHAGKYDKSGEDNSLANGMPNGAKDEDEDWELLPQHFDPQHVDRKKAVYVLSKIFAWRSKTSGFVLGQRHLQLVLPSQNVLRWLALAGYLTATEVEHALPQTATEFAARPYVAPGDIMTAVSEADPSFGLLHSLLALPAYWDLSEVVQALQVLIASFHDHNGGQNEEAQRLLTDGDVDMVDGADDDRSEPNIEAEEAAALAEVERVTRFLEAGLSTRSSTFRKCLDRLQEFPQKAVTIAMRAQMSQDEIIFFIHIMRMELANGGWTRPYDGTVEEELDRDFSGLGEAKDLSPPSNHAIRTIANLISSSVDAIGLSGWLVGQSGNSWSTEDLIESMVNETSAVVEGIYHSENLDTYLREMEKTAANVEQKQMTERTERKRKHDEIEWTPELALMPLGGRTDPPVLKGRFKKAVVAEQKSRSLGKYSFERIRI